MEHKRKSNNKNSLLLSIVALLLSLIIGNSAIFAWFTMIKDNKINSFELAVYSEDITETAVNTYAVKSIIQNGSQKIYTLAENQGSLITLFDIPEFDGNGIVLTDFMPCLAVKISFLLAIEKNCAVTAVTAEELTWAPLNYISNSMQFVSVNYSAQNLTLSSYNTPISFVTENNSQLTKINMLELTRNIFSPGQNSVWFILEYYPNAIEIINANTAENTNYITYSNDIIFGIKVI